MKSAFALLQAPVHLLQLLSLRASAVPSTACRLRNYQILTPAGAYVPAAMSGMADLTFKMKKVDPDIGPGNLQLPKRVSCRPMLVVGLLSRNVVYLPVHRTEQIMKSINW